MNSRTTTDNMLVLLESPTLYFGPSTHTIKKCRLYSPQTAVVRATEKNWQCVGCLI